MHSFKQILVATALLPLFLVAPAEARYPVVDAGEEARLFEAAATRTPVAFRVFCIQSPEQCASGAAEIALDPATYEMLELINLRVNASIRPQNEPGDLWQVNVAVGDCEDFALTKRAQLIEAGFSPGALRIAVGQTRKGEGHAVLVVRTDKGDFVLDNRFDTVRSPSLASINWISMSGANPLEWTEIEEL